MRPLHRILSTVCVCALLLALLCGLAPTASAEDAGLTVEYRFTGENAARPGYAEGVITLTPGASSKTSGYYVLYFADDQQILPGYGEIAGAEITGEPVNFTLPSGMALPEGATQLAVFESRTEHIVQPQLAEAVTLAIPQEKRFDSGRATLRFASLSDLHMNYDYAGEKWLRALEYLKEQEIDLVVLSGDYSNAGTLGEFNRYREQITQSGYAGTIWAAMGNHDSGNLENFLSCFSDEGTDGENLYFSRVAENGDVFLFMAQDMLPTTGDSNNVDCFSDAQMDWLEGQLAQYAGTGVNIFLIEHAGFENWGAGDATPNLYAEPLALREDFPNTLRLKALLEEYKELIFCTGHTHVAFAELVNYCDNGGASARMIHNSSVSQIRTFNANRTKLLYDTNDTDSEGYLATVYENDIVFRGMNLATHTYLPTACYIMAARSEKHDAPAASIDASQSRTDYTEGELPGAGDIVLTVTGADGAKQTVTEGYTVALYNGADNALAVDQTRLTKQTNRLLITYGGQWTFLDIKVKKNDALSQLTGKGTAEEPYTVATAEDFAVLMQAAAADSIPENAIFCQTADLTLMQGAIGGSFAGIYNGCGHTLTAKLTGENVSVFPELTGIVLNLHFAGELSASGTAQLIGGIAESGAVVNCYSDAALSGAATYGLAERIGGSIYNVYLGSSVPSARQAEESGLLSFYGAADDRFAAPAESEKEALARISEANSGATLAAQRLLKSVGYEAELTSWGGASQAPILFYVLISAEAVLVIVLIVLLCGMKKKKQ